MLAAEPVQYHHRRKPNGALYRNGFLAVALALGTNIEKMQIDRTRTACQKHHLQRCSRNNCACMIKLLSTDIRYMLVSAVSENNTNCTT
jgi:hypothetical protein